MADYGAKQHGAGNHDFESDRTQPRMDQRDMVPTPPSSEWEELIVRFLDAEASEEDAKDVRRLLPVPEFRKLLAVYAIDAANLFETRTLIDRSVFDRPRAHKEPHSPTTVQSANSRTKKMPPSSPSTGKPRRLGAVVATLAASIAVGVLLRAVVFTAPASSSDAVLFLCTLEGFNEGVCVAGELVTEECQVAAGQNVTTGGPLGTAKLRFADGTIIQLTGDSAARVYSSNGQKVVYVDRGHVGAEVAPQPRGRPLMIHTPNASLEVVGTEFVFSVSDVSTELNVTEGEVLMKPKGGGKGVAVKGGEYSAVHGDQREQILESILPAYRTANTPTHWQERFDHGLPEKWQAGTWVPTDGDGHAGGAVAACVELPVSADEESPSESEEAHYVVQSMANWPQGLVRLTKDSQLSYRVKMDRPQWYQVFIVVRGGPIEDGTWSWNYEFQEASQGNWSGVAPGEWREVSVPIAEFKRNNHPKYDSTEQPHFDKREGNPPPADGLVVWVLFSTQEFDRGLAIDDLTITSPTVEAASEQHGQSS